MPLRANQLLLPVLRAVLWGYILVAIFSFFGSPVNEFDDVIPLLHGQLVEQGRVPNRDFFSFYPPLGIYMNAAVFMLLGNSIISSRFIGAFFFLIFLFLVWRLFRKRFPDRIALIYMSILLVAVSVGAGLGVASWPGFALSLIAMLSYLLAQSLHRGRLMALAVAGLITSAATLYRINFGGYVVLVAAVDLLLSWDMDRPARWDKSRIRPFLASAAAFGVPWVMGCTLLCLLVFGSNAGRAIAEFVVTAQKFMATRGFLPLAYSPELTFFAMLPSAWFVFRILWTRESANSRALIAAVLAVSNLFIILICSKRPAVALIGLAVELVSVVFLHLFVWQLERVELNLVLYYCCMLHYFLSRSDWFHARWLPVLGVLLLPYILLQEHEVDVSQESYTHPGMAKACAILLAAIFLLTADEDTRPYARWTLNGVKLLALRIGNLRTPDSELVLGERTASPAWRTVYSDEDELAALRYLRSRSGNSPIFVGVGDHSRLFWNDLRAYWLADRPIGVRTFQLETHVATEAPVQKEIVADLEQNGVRWLFMDQVANHGDNTPAFRNYQGSTLLDKYVSSHFKQAARFGRYAVLTRIDGSPGQTHRIL